MEEKPKYAVGIDVGTSKVRTVLMMQDRSGGLAVAGYAEAENRGMRKGVVANLNGPVQAIDAVLDQIYRTSGEQVGTALLSINGESIYSQRDEGMITIVDKTEIRPEDLLRLEEAALAGKNLANREILDLVPLEYVLDEQRGIKTPLGMTGSRLMMRVNILSVLLPVFKDLKTAAEKAEVRMTGAVPSVVAGAEAVLTEKQKEGGVVVVDFGASTTGLAVYEEGELQLVRVLPVGSQNVTNDLAIVLEIDTDLAEELKEKYVSGKFGESDKEIVLKKGREELKFERVAVEEVVKARLVEIFGEIKKQLKMAQYDKRLPEGVVLVGGGVKMRGIEYFVKEVMGAATKIGEIQGFTGLANEINKPEWASAVGLAMLEMNRGETADKMVKQKKKSLLKSIFGGF